MTEPLLEVSDLRVDFRHDGRLLRAVDGLTYSLSRGHTVAVIGESGSGKTVSSRAIMGLLPPTANVTGSILFDDVEIVGLAEKAMRSHRGRGVAMVFQDPTRSLNPTMRIGGQIREAIQTHEKTSRAAAHDRALELLELVRLPAAKERLEQYPHQLSGGMRQRVMIAIALASSPKLLIADEATTALDVTTQAQIMELLRDLQQRLGMALIMISHDLGLAASFADEVVVMYAGRAVERAPTQMLFAHVRMPYTRALLDAIRVSRTRRTRRSPPCRASRPTWRCENRGARSRRAARAPPISAASTCRRSRSTSPTTSGRAGIHVPTGWRDERWPAARRTQPGARVRGPRPGRGAERGGAGGLGRLVHAGEGRDAGAGGRDRLGEVDARAGDLAGATSQVRRGAVRRGRSGQPAREAVAPGAAPDADGVPGPLWVARSEVVGDADRRGAADRVPDGGAKRRRRQVNEALDRVGLDPARYADRRPRSLSGGQAQRVAIARALALDPALIIYDEAVSSLDVLIRAQVLNLLERLRAELSLTYLFIAHDLALVKQVSDRVAVMYLGKLVEVGPAESLYREPLHPYTVALLASIPNPDPTAARAPVTNTIHGEPPSPMDPPSGCRFRTRCPHAQDVCAAEEPPLRRLAEGHFAACHFPVSHDAPAPAMAGGAHGAAAAN